MQIQHHDDGQTGEFFILDDQGERIAEFNYIWEGDHRFAANHTWVDDSLRGQGVARQLLDAAVAFAREKQVKIIPICSYVDVMFKRDKSFADVIA
ncbi:GNAT family N-acetyltransferase [Acinetobacter stercoris]|uniref:Uncharacterized protein n=1 Tax=Acinetobacter stercoris TaxID=2126983 RepID=A0A2U3MZ82_9GAMM|nr:MULTISPECIES: GNAT family N-acetyltransferase [Acinetobacter]SPL70736.1 hypothetical protein KPC_1914 [Acinetobacter stercoris]